MATAGLDYIYVTCDEPHAGRARQMLAAHPELKALAGCTPSSAIWAVCLVASQVAVAVLVGDRPWYVWAPVAYIFGATVNHALFILIHESCHNLVLRGRLGNRAVAIFSNFPLVVPGAAMGFWKFHLVHHRHMGEIELDAGAPGPTEARVIGRSGVLKGLWLAGTAFVQGVLRPMRITRVRVFDGWALANIAVQIVFLVALYAASGFAPIKYLIWSTVFAIGFHPLGARWIQEHFAVVPDQETYSYYGPLNKVSFNAGYHTEHHDLIWVPWSRLPQVRTIAPEFYDTLYSYDSWTALLLRFLRDRNITLFTYVVRPLREESARPVARDESPA